ncbi:DNA translocase FtsK 4TM domain-containing protein [Halosquirtibacter xylanolyticus]|uniref:FtsK/SpoIIIE family DNA translocase n=1 Tax=Halosquirtibacter xylanolyticus TaxID=3374599 RepID=UPI00374A3AF0|nr:DNA translocase FtsK 4TM domain-containing protein [Prolixibacteraceae bacterium]
MIKNKTKSISNLFSKVKNLRPGGRIKLIFALLSFGFALYLLISLLLFFILGKSDQSALSITVHDILSDPTNTIHNIGGKSGIYLGDFLINRYLGLSSFGLVYFFVLLGFLALGGKKRFLIRSVKLMLIMAWTSVTLGFLFVAFYENSNFFPGGAYGLYYSQFLNSIIGKLGTFLVLAITAMIFMIYEFDNFPDLLKSAMEKVADFFSFGLQRIVNFFKSLSFKKVKKESLASKVSNNEADIVMEETFEQESSYPEEPMDEEHMEHHEFEPYVQSPVREHVEMDPMPATTSSYMEEEPTPAPIVNPIPVAPVEAEEDELSLEVTETIHEEQVGELDHTTMDDYDPTLDLSSYRFPGLDLLRKFDSQSSIVTNDELQENKERIVETLRNYNIEIKSIKATTGPTITLYEIIPAPGVRINKIKNLENDIALSLAALGIRIIAPIPGKGTIGIEVPNQKAQIVSMREIIGSKKFSESDYELPIAFGKTISNEVYMVDLVKMPHILVAGATGQGKSVGLNAMITSLLFKKHPSQLKFVFVDPKKVELSLYSVIEKHFLAKMEDEEEPIITDVQKVKNTLNSVCIEMDNRYDLLKNAHARNIKEYNKKFVERKLNPEKGHHYLPYIVVIVDEFADLIMTAGKEIESPIARIAQLARAVGIHMIIATQRPSANIITGPIKANFPARVAFKVASMIDSRTILDSPGANQLIGKGDMLIQTGSEMTRVQCAFIDTPEVEELVEFIGEQRGYPTAFLLPEYKDESSQLSDDADLENRDELFEEAARLLVMNQVGSTSAIQRKFSIGYNRAGRIIDQLEYAGVVGPNEGSKARKVLIPDETNLEMLLQSL